MNGLKIQWGKSVTSWSWQKTQLSFPISFNSADSWVGATQNTKSVPADATSKIWKANDGGHYYAITCGYDDEKIDWIAIGY